MRINWDNIKGGKNGPWPVAQIFKINNYGKQKTYGSYDYHSIMHFESMDFSGNGEKTIGELSDIL